MAGEKNTNTGTDIQLLPPVGVLSTNRFFTEVAGEKNTNTGTDIQLLPPVGVLSTNRFLTEVAGEKNTNHGQVVTAALKTS